MNYMDSDGNFPSALVHATTWALLSLSTVLMGFRGYSRLRKVGVGLKEDDWVLLAGWFFLLLASCCLSWLMVVLVVPESLSKFTIARAHHNLQAIALGLTKTSFGITLLRLMPGGWEAKLIWGIIISMNLQFFVHIIATWQAICGAPVQPHIGGDRCWTLVQSITFSIFSALYSALCDFVLAMLPWRMIFNLQMKRAERIRIALALSLGMLAGIMGVMKAVQAHKLIDLQSPEYFHNQAVFWIWSMAEPNVTIISACLPVLRSLVRNVRTRTDSTPRAGGYLKTGDNSAERFYTRTTTTAVRAAPKDQDGASDSSILGRNPQDGDSGSGEGIARTTEISVTYESSPRAGSAITKASKSVEEFEMGNVHRISGGQPRETR